MSTSEPAQPADLVVVGSSAGGIEALSILVSALPADFPAPLVLAQHLDPTRPSSLLDILQRRTKLRVEMVEERSALRVGTIYVVPSNRHVAINDGHVELMGDQRDRPRPSVDLLLSTAAAAYGERLIAVILTGSGSDGAMGAVTVKEAGGTVVVQNPQTARYPSMPAALPPTVVDFEVDLERLGPLLQELLTGTTPLQPGEKTEDVLRDILTLVTRQANMNFRPYKTSTMLRRIGRRMVVTQQRTMRDYATHLEHHPEEIGELVSALLINVTQFFRDTKAFDYLRDSVLPQLIERNRTQGRTLRCWSAGCATGEEAYSLAMLIVDQLGAELPHWDVKIFATDVDQAAIAFARQGVYPATLLAQVSDDYRERFFEPSETGFRIGKMLRQMVIFGHHDLSRSAPFPRIDLLLCRNVLIYFTPDLQDYVLGQFSFSLASNQGYLFLGKAETVRPTLANYELVQKQWRVYACTGPAFLRRPLSSTSQSAPPPPASSPDASEPAGEQEVSLSIDLAQLRRANELLLRFLPYGVVVIDNAYRILSTNAAARRLLGLRDTSAGQDFLHAVRDIPYTEVRSGIDHVFRERTTVTLGEVDITGGLDGNSRVLALTIMLMQVETGASDVVAISVSDVTEHVQANRQIRTVQAEQARLVAELETANRRLNDVNKELLDANEELQVSNEELVLTHEELQATVEEFETTNEELQATNEEFETTNEELQSTNEELETTNEELRVRTQELQDLTGLLEHERTRLSNIVELAPLYIMVLSGPDLVVEAFNPYNGAITTPAGIVGKPIQEVVQAVWGGQEIIAQLAHEAYTQDVPRTTPRAVTYTQREQDKAYVEFNIVPTHDAAGAVSGVVLYGLDVTEQRLRESEAERQRLTLIFEHAEHVALALYDAETARLLMASPRYLGLVKQLNDTQEEQVIGANWHDLECITPLDQSLRQWQDVVTSRQQLRLPEVQAIHDSAKQNSVWDWTLTPIPDPKEPERVQYMLISAVDITDQVHVREEIERLDKLKDEFLSLASHELRTPMTPLIGFADMLARTLTQYTEQPNDQQQVRMAHMIASIRHQLQRLNGLIDDLLDVARLQSGKFSLKMESLDLAQVVQRAVEEAQMISPNHTFNIHILE